MTTLKETPLKGKAASCGLFPCVCVTDPKDSLKQPPLPYAYDALKPFLSKEQMQYHYDKHHASYFKKLKELIKGKSAEKISLEEIVLETETGTPVFNNAAQAWNHAFFWNCMAPSGEGGKIDGEMKKCLEENFGSIASFEKEFVEKAMAVFGSGWCWVAMEPKSKKLEIMGLSNADCPQKHGCKPLLVVDTWEHAYYVDYRNEKEKYYKAFLKYVNWNFLRSLCEKNS